MAVMRFRSSRPQTPPPHTGQADDHAARLSRVRPLVHDDDERAVPADRDAYRSPFHSLIEPVDYPGWLKPRKARRRP
jgi:hypothetical protein